MRTSFDEIAYSFHQMSAWEPYDAMYQAYCNIFERIGLEYRLVIADNGSIGVLALMSFTF